MLSDGERKRLETLKWMVLSGTHAEMGFNREVGWLVGVVERLESDIGKIGLAAKEHGEGHLCSCVLCNNMKIGMDGMKDSEAAFQEDTRCSEWEARHAD